MIPGSYVRHALATAIRIARADRQAIAEFDHSFEGFYRSFYGIVLCAPIYALMVLGERRIAMEEPAATDPDRPLSLGLFALEAMNYLVGWLAFPLVMIGIVRLIGATPRYVPFIVAYNWTSCIVYAVTVVPYALYLAGALTPTALVAMLFPISLLTLVYRWIVAREALQIPNMTAVGITILDALLGTLLAVGASQMKSLL
jgi:hypothetical protein